MLPLIVMSWLCFCDFIIMIVVLWWWWYSSEFNVFKKCKEFFTFISFLFFLFLLIFLTNEDECEIKCESNQILV